VDGGSPSGPGETSLKTGGTSSKKSVLVRVQRGVNAVVNQMQMRTDPTYRRMARGLTLPDGSRRVFCHHIRKTAGTSLFLSFLALGGEDPMVVWRRIAASRLQRTTSAGYGFASINRSVLAEGAYLFGRAHRSVSRQPLPSGTFTVTILRDPVERVHSYFDYLVAGDDPDLPGQVSQRERQIVRDGFDSFIDRVPVNRLLSQLVMFSDRLDVHEAADRVSGCSSVFFTEDFSAGLAKLAHRLDLPLVPHRTRVTTTRSTLTDRQRERLRARLEPEYELLALLDRAGIATRGSADSA
jgi:hypothetical protein